MLTDKIICYSVNYYKEDFHIGNSLGAGGEQIRETNLLNSQRESLRIRGIGGGK